MTAALQLGSFVFRTELGSTPLWNISGGFERERSGQLNQYVHTIKLSGTLFPAVSAITAAAKQDSLNERKKALIEQLESGLQVLTIFDSDGTTVSIQYGGADPTGTFPNALYYATQGGLGVQIDTWDLPDHQADILHVNRQDYTIDISVVVEAECDAEGIQGCNWTSTERFQNNILTAIDYSGWVRTCDGTDCHDVINDLIADLRVMAIATFASSGTGVIVADRIQELSKTITEDKDRPGRCGFTVTFGLRSDTSGTVAEALSVNASLTIIGNKWTLNLTGQYTYADTLRSTVIDQARVLTGVSVDDYVPSGGTKIIHTQTQMSFNEEANQVSATQTIVGIWTHSTNILALSERIQVERDTATVTPRIKGWLFGDTAPPPCSLHVGGAGPATITVTTEIEARNNFQDIPRRFTEDFFAGPVLRSNSVGWSSLTEDVEQTITQEGLYKSSLTQVWIHPDIASLPTPIPLSSLISATQSPIPLPEA